MIVALLKVMLRTGALLLAFALFVGSPFRLAAQDQSSPGIKITEVPSSAVGGPDKMFPISGTVTNVPPKDYRVCIYVYAGGTWFVQPFDYAPLTDIKSNSKWETETHGGTIYAALLVRHSYKAKAQLKVLPDAGDDDVVARDRVAGKE